MSGATGTMRSRHASLKVLGERALRMAKSVAWPSLRVRADLMWRKQKKKPTSPTGCAGHSAHHWLSTLLASCMYHLWRDGVKMYRCFAEPSCQCGKCKYRYVYQRKRK